MKLWQKMLIEVLQKEEIRVEFPNLTLGVSDILERESFAALQRIRAIIEDYNLDDFECIERIVVVFEEIGSSGGNRHDFG